MISFYLAKILQDTGVEVKIIEENKKRCEELSEALPHAMIIQGEAIDKELLLEEEIRETDAFAAMTDIDEENIMLIKFNMVNGEENVSGYFWSSPHLFDELSGLTEISRTPIT